MAELKCPVVGIGASAGELKVLETFFDRLPPDTGAAYVVVQHLDPMHESAMAEILGRHTRMPAAQIENGMRVKADHVYIIPPNASLALHDHTFRLGKAAVRKGLRMPIDSFLTSLADASPELAIAIVLSGTGSDGAQGVRAVKGTGGLTLAQTPETAEHDGMPRAAIDEMPGHLGRYLTHPYVRGAGMSALGAPLLGRDELVLGRDLDQGFTLLLALQRLVPVQGRGRGTRPYRLLQRHRSWTVQRAVVPRPGADADEQLRQHDERPGQLCHCQD